MLVWGQVFLLAMLASIVFTVIFTFGSAVWYFTLVVIGNRFVQAAGRSSPMERPSSDGHHFSMVASPGWPAAVKLASKWYHTKEVGKAMGFISLSFLFGGTIRNIPPYDADRAVQLTRHNAQQMLLRDSI